MYLIIIYIINRRKMNYLSPHADWWTLRSQASLNDGEFPRQGRELNLRVWNPSFRIYSAAFRKKRSPNVAFMGRIGWWTRSSWSRYQILLTQLLLLCNFSVFPSNLGIKKIKKIKNKKIGVIVILILNM